MTESATESSPISQTSSRIFCYIVFGVALVAQLFFVTRNIDQEILVGHEFRQTQTALITRYIDQNNDFSLAYETPLFGPPWRMPLEVPIYQWCVVAVMRTTDLPDVVAARVVTLASFYLLLGAGFRLLGQIGLNRPERLLVLAVVLLTPLYLFYSRTFMIDPMATMFSAWFLTTFVEAMRTRKFRWWLAATLVGTAAGLLKSVVFLVWVVPAAIYGAWCLWQAWRNGAMPAARQTAAWGVSIMALPVVATKWWVAQTDAVKEGNPLIEVFTSYNLGLGNFGVLDLGARFSGEVWSAFVDILRVGFNVPWLLGLMWIGLLVGAKGMRSRIAGAIGLFALPPLIAPYAYAWQDYYFYSCGVFAAAATGLGLVWLARNPKLPWIAKAVIVLVPLAGQVWAFSNIYLPQQKVVSEGGSHFKWVVRDHFPADSVIMVQGADWAAMWAYYSHRRTLMIRTGMYKDETYMDYAIDILGEELVDGLVIDADMAEKATWGPDVAKRLGLNPWPTLIEPGAELYLSPRVEPLIRSLYGNWQTPHLTAVPAPENIAKALNLTRRDVNEKVGAALFPLVNAPIAAYRFEYGVSQMEVNGAETMNFHPSADLWFDERMREGRVELEFGIIEAAYAHPHDHTTGVGFVAFAESPDGQRREVWRRNLTPAALQGDRGTQVGSFAFQLEEGEQLVLTTSPMGSPSFDWAFLKRLDWIEAGE